MPTFKPDPGFLRDYGRLTAEEQARFHRARVKFVHGLRTGHFQRSLRIRGVAGHPGVYEMMWAPDGRATFRYGDEIRPGEPHIVWRRIGGHEIFEQP